MELSQKRVFSSCLSKDYMFLLGIILFGLIIRLFLLVGTASLSDGAVYIRLAYDLSKGNLDIIDEKTYGFRFLMYIPISISILLFGFNDFAFILPSLILSLAGIILTYYFALLIQDDKKIALLAAFFIATFPLEVIYATALTLDGPSSFFLSLTLFFYLFALKEEEKNDPDNKKNYFYYFLTGISFGTAYQIRELSIIAGLFFFTVFFIDIWKRNTTTMKHIFFKYFLISFGFSLLIILEITLTYIFTGYPLLRYWRSYGIGWGPPGQEPATGISTTPERYASITKLDRYLISIVSPSLLLGYSFYFFIFGLFILYKNWNSDKLDRQKSSLIILWISIILVYLEFGTANPFEWRIFEKNTRFLLTISIPLWVTNALSFSFLPDSLKNKSTEIPENLQNMKSIGIYAFLLILIISSNLIFCLESRSLVSDTKPSKEVYDYISTIPISQDIKVYVYPSTIIINLKYYYNYQHPIFLSLKVKTEVSNNSYAVISDGMWNIDISDFLLRAESSNWTLLTVISKYRNSLFPGGSSYNYSSYIFYIKG